MLYKSAWNRKTDIKAIQKQNNLIKKWTIFLYVCFVMMLVTRVSTSFISKNPGSFNNDYLWIPSLVWMVVFVTLILTPEILYGYNFLNKTIDEAAEKVVLKNVWVTEGTVISNLSERDKKIDEKMKVAPNTKVCIYSYIMGNEGFRRTQTFNGTIDTIGKYIIRY
jgi:hypothetical protein